MIMCLVLFCFGVERTNDLLQPPRWLGEVRRVNPPILYPREMSPRWVLAQAAS